MATVRDYNRYELVTNDDGTVDQMPFVPIPSTSTDKYVQWIVGKNRLDKLSQRYYATPYYDWLIIYANPEFITEFDIPDGATIRIPFPLDRVLGYYQEILSTIRSQ